MNDLRAEFLAEARDNLASIEAACAALERQATDQEALRLALRLLHSIKGTCGFFALDALETAAHATETLLCELRDRRRRATPATFDAVFAGLDEIRSCLADSDTGGEDTAWTAPRGLPGFATRAPVWRVWRLLPALVQDLSRRLHKPIALQFEGADLEADRRTLHALRAPLIHLVRNAADHGLERPEEREWLGKPAVGTIRLAARHDGGRTVLEVADDGRGIQVQQVRRKIIERGLVSTVEAAALPDRAVLAYLFRPGFSTAAAVSAVSGHGIGLDVVRAAREEIGGTVALDAMPGRGTRATLNLPADEAGAGPATPLRAFAAARNAGDDVILASAS
jgi:chemotaxis protein histidine kinase CheA